MAKVYLHLFERFVYQWPHFAKKYTNCDWVDADMVQDKTVSPKPDSETPCKCSQLQRDTREKETSGGYKEHGTLGLLGLSPSLLGGGTLGNPPHNMWTPQKPPGPGHPLVYHNP